MVMIQLGPCTLYHDSTTTLPLLYHQHWAIRPNDPYWSLSLYPMTINPRTTRDENFNIRSQ